MPTAVEVVQRNAQPGNWTRRIVSLVNAKFMNYSRPLLLAITVGFVTSAGVAIIFVFNSKLNEESCSVRLQWVLGNAWEHSKFVFSAKENAGEGNVCMNTPPKALVTVQWGKDAHDNYMEGVHFQQCVMPSGTTFKCGDVVGRWAPGGSHFTVEEEEHHGVHHIVERPFTAADSSNCLGESTYPECFSTWTPSVAGQFKNAMGRVQGVKRCDHNKAVRSTWEGYDKKAAEYEEIRGKTISSEQDLEILVTCGVHVKPHWETKKPYCQTALMNGEYRIMECQPILTSLGAALGFAGYIELGATFVIVSLCVFCRVTRRLNADAGIFAVCAETENASKEVERLRNELVEQGILAGSRAPDSASGKNTGDLVGKVEELTGAFT